MFVGREYTITLDVGFLPLQLLIWVNNRESFLDKSPLPFMSIMDLYAVSQAKMQRGFKAEGCLLKHVSLMEVSKQQKSKPINQQLPEESVSQSGSKSWVSGWYQSYSGQA